MSPTQRTQQWKIFVLKLLWVLKSFGIKMATQAVLGKEAYQRIFQQHKQRLERPKQDYKVINREIVGNPLPPGKGKGEIDPTMCPHDRTYLKRRGNKDSKQGKWWTCIACNPRWERKSLDEIHTDVEGRDTDLVGFGAHANKTYLQLLENEKSYCQWVLMTAEMEEDRSPALARLAKYLVQKEMREAQVQQGTGAEEYQMTSDAGFSSDGDF